MKNNSTRKLVYLSVSANNGLLSQAITNLSIAARIVDGIDDLSDLTFNDIENISRSIHLALAKLESINESVVTAA